MRVYTIRGYEDYAIQTPPAPRHMVSRYVPVSGTSIDSDTLETVSVTPFDVDDLDADIRGVVGLDIESDADDTDTDSKAPENPVQVTRGRGRPRMTAAEKLLTAAHRAGQHGLPVADCPNCKRHS